jgi:hypothetical protein
MSTTTDRSSRTSAVTLPAAPITATAPRAADTADVEPVVAAAVGRILTDPRLRGHIEGHDLTGVRSTLADQTRRFLLTGELPLLGPDGSRYRADAVQALRAHWVAARVEP